jgi:protein-tyrosine phosphatase
MPIAFASLPLLSGQVALCAQPGRGSSYDADLAEVLRFAPDLVLSMTTAEELAAKGAATLAEDLDRHGIAWVHLPIPDFGTPPEAVTALWPQTAAQAQAILARGGRVLAHCMGGCGRSGMAVLRLMVEAGETPEAALTRLRAVRPCAVETEAQFAWAAQR